MPLKRKPADIKASRFIARADKRFRKLTGLSKDQVGAGLLLAGVGIVIGLSLIGDST